MKKTLAAVAVLGAFAGSALAADVTLYGLLDTGFAYNHVDLDNGTDATDSFGMNSGMNSGARFGLKGTEDLGNGLTVGFILENQFTGDDGALVNDRLWNREADLFLQGSFGRLGMGRMASINGGGSSWGKIGGYMSAFGTSNWGGYASNLDNTFKTQGFMDNVISYETPSFAGFKVYAQYSMGAAADKVENESKTDRYYVLGATYNNGPLGLMLSVDSINYKSFYKDEGQTEATAHDTDDSLTVTFGGNYDFEVVKVYGGVQYFDEVVAFGKLAEQTGFKNMKIKGFGVNLSMAAPVAGGTAKVGLGYVDAEAADSETTKKDAELNRYIVSLGYDYSLSKRTTIYGVASYTQDKVKNIGTTDIDPSAYTISAGLLHKF